MKALRILTIIFLLSFRLVLAGNEDDNKKGDLMNATISINGVVIDKLTGEALTGVKVELSGTSEATYTDFEGNFYFERLEPGKYRIETSLISYKNKSEELELNSNQRTIEIKLETVNQ